MSVLPVLLLRELVPVAPSGASWPALANLLSAAAAARSLLAWRLSESLEVASDTMTTSSPTAGVVARSGWRGGGDRRLGSSR